MATRLVINFMHVINLFKQNGNHKITRLASALDLNKVVRDYKPQLVHGVEFFGQDTPITVCLLKQVYNGYLQC